MTTGFFATRVYQLDEVVGILRLSRTPATTRALTVNGGALVGCSDSNDLAYNSSYTSSCLRPDVRFHFHPAIGGQHRTFVDIEVWVVF